MTTMPATAAGPVAGAVIMAAEGVTYRAGGRPLVADVTLALDPGTVTVVVGPNGAGKSTLIRLMSGELRPSGGRVLSEGEDVSRMAPWRLSCRRAVLPQASRLAFPFRVAEVARIGLDGVGRALSRRERAAILVAALERADVHHLSDRHYQTLSGGEQQRAQFARVLCQLAAGRTLAERQVLLLDEPVASLDLKHQLALLESARGLAADGVAVLAVLHDLNLAAAFADLIAVMSAGRLVALGAPANVLHDGLVAEVFEVALPVGVTPPKGQPFILPRRQPLESQPG